DLTQRFSAGAAVRYEDYENSGNATVYKLNGIFKVTDGFAIRATVGTGFHAPSPGQNNVQVLTTNFIAGVSVQTGTYPVTSAIAQFYGARALKPEKSDNYGIGVVINPTDALTLTAGLHRDTVGER